MSKQKTDTQSKQKDVKELRAEFDRELEQLSTEELLSEADLLAHSLERTADIADYLWMQAKDTKNKFVKFECEQALDYIVNARQELKSANSTLLLELKFRGNQQ